jgi:hypothetical protein
MIQPDENMEKYLALFCRKPAPEGLKARTLEGTRRRAGEDSSPLMTPRLWTILAAESLTLLLLLVFAPGKTAMGKYADFFVSREATERDARLLAAVAEMTDETVGLSDAGKARLGRRLALDRSWEPSRPRPSTSKYWED